jgi:acetylornithine deacetylase/succinyl-diaminopimelate desuccinylase family protein
VKVKRGLRQFRRKLMAQDSENTVLKLLEHKRQESIELLRSLIKIRSVTGEEGEIAAFITQWFKTAGFENIEMDEMGNVICRIPGDGKGLALLYNGHMDTVPVGEEFLWEVDPFGAEILEDRIIGRGACDMKGSIAAMMMAVCALKEAGIQLKGNLTLTMVVEEEKGLQEATRFTIESLSAYPDIALVGEATNYNVSLGSRGGIAVEVSVMGKTAHAANPSEGINAILKMNKVIDAIQRMKLPSQEFLGPTTQAITNITCSPAQLNVVPDLCTISIDRRIVVGDNVQSTKKEFQKVIDRLKAKDPELNAKMEARMRGLPTFLNDKEPVVKMLQGCVDRVMGRRPQLSSYRFGTDASYLGAVAKIPTVGFGPGDERNAHTPNEFVKIDDLIIASKVYALFVLRLLS